MVILQFRPATRKQGKCLSISGRTVLEALSNLDLTINTTIYGKVPRSILDTEGVNIYSGSLKTVGSSMLFPGLGTVTRMPDKPDRKWTEKLSPLDVVDTLSPWQRQVILDKVFVELFGEPDGSTFDLDKETGGDELSEILTTVTDIIETFPRVKACQKT